MRYKIIVVAIVALYFLFNIATRKDFVSPYDECFNKTGPVALLTQTGKFHFLFSLRDTVFVMFTDTVGINANTIADQLCRRGLDTCGLPPFNIQIADTVNVQQIGGGMRGRRLLLKQCR